MDFKFLIAESKQLYNLFELLPLAWAKVPFSCTRILCLTFYDILLRLKWKKTTRQCHFYHPLNSLALPKFRNTIIIILYFACSIVSTTSSNQFSNLCSCNHWNWSVVAIMVCYNLTLQPWLRFSDVFIYIYYCS